MPTKKPRRNLVKEAQIGEGAFGVVWLVRCKDGCRLVQKEIQLEMQTDSEKRSTINEAKALRSLSHPRIIAYVDAYFAGNTLNLIMELADGGDLSAVIAHTRRRADRLPEETVLSYIGQLIDALAYCHHQVRAPQHRCAASQCCNVCHARVLRGYYIGT